MQAYWQNKPEQKGGQCIFKGGTACLYCGKLDQHIRTVLPVFHHPLDRFQMSDGTGKAIEDRLGLGVLMVMRRKDSASRFISSWRAWSAW